MARADPEADAGGEDEALACPAPVASRSKLLGVIFTSSCSRGDGLSDDMLVVCRNELGYDERSGCVRGFGMGFRMRRKVRLGRGDERRCGVSALVERLRRREVTRW